MTAISVPSAVSVTARSVQAASDASAPVSAFDNGLLVRAEGNTDVYELPSGSACVPAKITVEHRAWWRGGDRITAVNAGGERLKAKAAENALWITDARTGAVTKIDTQTHDITVSAKETTSTRIVPQGCRSTTTRPLQQILAADGEMRIVTRYRREEHRVAYGSVRDMPANVSTTIQRDEDYEETVLSPTGEAFRTVRWHRDKYDQQVEKGELASRLDQSGDLAFTDETGNEQVFHLFIAPHAMARR